jgi:hypothetical protein
MGAVSADGTQILNHEVIRWLNISGATIDALIATESAESRVDPGFSETGRCTLKAFWFLPSLS